MIFNVVLIIYRTLFRLKTTDMLTKYIRISTMYAKKIMNNKNMYAVE